MIASRPLRTTAPLAGLLVLLALPAAAQSRREIGTTSVGNPVLLEPRTVRRGADGIVTAAVRVKFLKPVKAGPVMYRSSRTIAMFDCAKRVVAVKENWYYSDDAGTAVANHKVVGLPGFGPAIKGSLPDVAMAHLCAAR
jgi:hypothetical protein